MITGGQWGGAKRASILTMIPSARSDQKEKGNEDFQLLRYLRKPSDSLFIKCILILILLCPKADLPKKCTES